MKATASAPPPEYYNTYIGFGDSITWGKIEGVQRLDLCFLTQMRDTYLAADYGPADFINLGIPALGTYEAALRVDQDLDNYSAFYFLLMLGVNDVQSSDFSLASRMEDMEYIIDAALARHMRVIVSTLTPRKDEKANLQWFWDNLNNFSSAILQLAAEKGVARIDTLSAFMNTAPPDGWKMLLEQIIPGVSKGNHPNGEGHKLIATLFSEALIAFPPLPPQSITVIDPDNNRQRTALWKANYESDFSHFHIEFDFLPQKFEYALDITTAYHTFILFPFLPQLYFRVQTFDRGNRQSIFSTLESADAPTQLKLSKKSRPGR